MGWSVCQCQNALQATGGSIVYQDGGLGQSGLVDPPGNLRTDLSFDWQRSEPSVGTCEPGDYTGTFIGAYSSGEAFGAPIPVAALGTADRPGLAFTLAKSGNGEVLTISNGHVIGTADGLFPFEGDLSGSLDCKTRVFTATLKGHYTAVIGDHEFEGPVTGKYDKNAHTFTDGTWSLTEIPGLPIPGGLGSWEASWVP
jgi:hypothetical protein